MARVAHTIPPNYPLTGANKQGSLLVCETPGQAFSHKFVHQYYIVSQNLKTVAILDGC